MDQVEEREVEISREFDYSNSVPEVQSISFLAQYCDSYYKQLMKMCEEDEEKNGSSGVCRGYPIESDIERRMPRIPYLSISTSRYSSGSTSAPELRISR